MLPLEPRLHEQIAPWLEAELRQLTGGMVRLSQQVRAHEYVLDMLLLSHPDPERALHMWQMTQPQMIDTMMKVPTHDGEGGFKQVVVDAWQEIILHYTELLEQVAEFRRDTQGDD
ncbi:hypothetical protein SAMN05216570_0615 [Dyella sp. OK004]|uniref:hypothetical protein n=1 Tax=Dyella sp. OK004 TaxID=1855292 RepID=UPI0008E7A785|nr:hypothetical protein [Dyella sp. OK004]SFR91867.1 hypothetical protein SAMN05216570_0615 [Dyella sp. OK004]